MRSRPITPLFNAVNQAVSVRATGAPLLKVDQLGLGYPTRRGRKQVLADFSFSLEPGQTGCLIGGSGSGKSTLLRAIAGFEHLEGGSIWLDGLEVSRPGYNLAPEKRGLGMVFQDFALFPHLSVAANLASGLTRLSANEREQRVLHELERVGLADLAPAYPHQLSGGQKQRVAIARALAPRPQLLLMDEPFSNLDPELRLALRSDLYRLLRESATTCLLVTHDQHDAFALSDMVGVIHNGRLRQWDTPYALYHTPCDRLVADFVGEGVFVPGMAKKEGVETELGFLSGRAPEHLVGGRVEVLIRPEDLLHNDDSNLALPISERVFRGDSFLYSLSLPSGLELKVIVDSHHNHNPGEKLGVDVALDHLVVFPAQQ